MPENAEDIYVELCNIHDELDQETDTHGWDWAHKFLIDGFGLTDEQATAILINYGWY